MLQTNPDERTHGRTHIHRTKIVTTMSGLPASGLDKKSVTATIVAVHAVKAMGVVIFLYMPVALFSLKHKVWPVVIGISP